MCEDYKEKESCGMQYGQVNHYFRSTVAFVWVGAKIETASVLRCVDEWELGWAMSMFLQGSAAGSKYSSLAHPGRAGGPYYRRERNLEFWEVCGRGIQEEERGTSNPRRPPEWVCWESHRKTRMSDGHFVVFYCKVGDVKSFFLCCLWNQRIPHSSLW